MKAIRVIGAGLAGSEAALTLAKLGAKVILIDMKPESFTPAHHQPGYAELVCSNSFKSKQVHTAPGLQKAELGLLGSSLLDVAYRHAVPAGAALAVDRERFSEDVTNLLRNSANIELRQEEVHSLPDDDLLTIVATGPLTQGSLFADIQQRLSRPTLHFFDAAAPIVAGDSIDMSIAFRQSRYDKGSADYINCPFTKEEYERFYEALITAELAEVEGFDKEILFEGCMPVESMAKRGPDTLRFGPLKPVGLTSPHSTARPYAVVQLRMEDEYASMYNLVGFQTRLKFPEQNRVFRMIPGLQNAEFLRYGVMHRNSYISSAGELSSSFRLLSDSRYFFAGQITGLEGYLAAIASGHLAALNAFLANSGQEADFVLPLETINGQLSRYVSRGGDRDFQPMNANFGLLPPLNERIRNKQERGKQLAERSIDSLKVYLAERNKSV